MAERERASVVYAAESLRAAGLPAPVVSVGSSPTAHFARDLTGVTEVRAGVFVFFDLVMAGIGVCQIDDIAMSVLSSGHRPPNREAARSSSMPAGWRLSRDLGTSSQSVDQGYGLVCDVNGVPYRRSHREEHESGARAARDSRRQLRAVARSAGRVRSCAFCRTTRARRRLSTPNTSCWMEIESAAAGRASPQAGSRHPRHDRPALSALSR